MNSTYILSFFNVCPPWAILWLISVMSGGGCFRAAEADVMIRCYMITKKNQPPDKALIVHFLAYFYYGMSYCFLIAAPYKDRWGGCFCAADSCHITGVIPFNFKYGDGYQQKLISTHGVIGLYIYTKFYHILTTVSDTVVDYSHVRRWLFSCSWNLSYNSCHPLWLQIQLSKIMEKELIPIDSSEAFLC